MKEVTYIDPLSLTKIAALLGILWAVLGWVFSGLVITLLVQGANDVADIPQAFHIGGLISGILGGFIGGGLSGFLGSVVYNQLCTRIGGIKVSLSDATAPVVPDSPPPEQHQQ